MRDLQIIFAGVLMGTVASVAYAAVFPDRYINFVYRMFIKK